MTTERSSQPMALPADDRQALRQVVRACRKASLATMGADAGPYVSLVAVAIDHDLAPLLLLSSLAEHTRNLERDTRVSLLFDGTDPYGNPQAGPRVTLSGKAARSKEDRLLNRYLARLPAASHYAGFADFALWRVEPERAHFVGGFGRAQWYEAPFGLDEGADAIKTAEAEILEEINAAGPDAIERLARAVGTDESIGGGWRMIAVDCDGCDLRLGSRLLRVQFKAPANNAQGVREEISGFLKKSAG